MPEAVRLFPPLNTLRYLTTAVSMVQRSSTTTIRPCQLLPTLREAIRIWVIVGSAWILLRFDTGESQSMRRRGLRTRIFPPRPRLLLPVVGGLEELEPCGKGRRIVWRRVIIFS